VRPKQIVVISGKGGTGKTVMTGALAALAENKVMADCDVDAADLHLLLKPEIKEKHLFKSGSTAFINKENCIQCQQCIEICRFDAISREFVIDPIDCEGCGFCKWVCPMEAIEMRENNSGDWFVSDTRFGSLVHARLGIAEENSGKLVALVRQKANELAKESGAEWIIIDGSPGIGCPVIASLTGSDLALIVTEPTLAGLHDAERVIRVAKHFNIPVKVVINKYDLNLDVADKIEKYCQTQELDLIGKIKFDETIVKAMVCGKTIMEYSSDEAQEEIKSVWQKIQKI